MKRKCKKLCNYKEDEQKRVKRKLRERNKMRKSSVILL